MNEKLFLSELKVMKVVWEKGKVTAKKIAADMAQSAGWSKITTYTVIKNASKKV